MKAYRLPLFLLLENFSSWLVFISVLTYAGYELGASATEVALVTVSMLVPQALLGSLFQRVVRQQDERSVVLTVTALQVAFGVLLMFAQTTLVLCLVLLGRAFVLGFFQPAFAAIAAQHKGSGSLASQVSLINSLSRIVAPALGGLVGARYGEAWVFGASAVLAALALPVGFLLPRPARVGQPEERESSGAVLSRRGILLLLALPVLFVNGLSMTFSNLLPYAFSFYNLPKSLLAFAISCSALGGIIANLVLLKSRFVVDGYPKRRLGLAWMTNALLFIALALVMLQPAIAAIAIPVIFFLLSGTRALFVVSMNGFIFSMDRVPAIALATHQQTLGAGTGLAATFIVAAVMELSSPAATMTVGSIFAVLAGLVWMLSLGKRPDVMGNPPTESPLDLPEAKKPG